MNTGNPQVFIPGHPGLSKAADMLERVRAEAAELRNFTITFLSLLVYIAIIIADTTHEQILRIDPVKLPLLNVDIPIAGFYWFMPGFLFFIHLYILIQHYLFSQLAFRFRTVLESETDEETINHLRRSLGNLPFLHWLAGQHDSFMNFLMNAITIVSLIIWPVWTFWWLQATFLPYHNNTIVWTQRIFLFLDVALIAYLWALILDDEDDASHWWQPLLKPLYWFFANPIKLFLWWLCRKLTEIPQFRWPRWNNFIENVNNSLGLTETDFSMGNHAGTFKSAVNRWFLLVFLMTALFFSLFVSTVPDTWEDRLWSNALSYLDSRIDSNKENFPVQKDNPRRNFPLTNWLHEQREVKLHEADLSDFNPARIRELDECSDQKSKRHPASLNESEANVPVNPKTKELQKCYLVDGFFPRNLILNERTLIANKDLPPEILVRLDAKNEPSDPEALTKVQRFDLRGRHLEYADFRKSSLPNADLRRARLHATNFSDAKLDAVWLQSADISIADLSKARLPGADLSAAQLSGADLTSAHLPGANLAAANLEGSTLNFAELTGSNLSESQLSGADLSLAKLSNADLSSAQLQGANMALSKLTGANLKFAQLTGANLAMAQLIGVDLSSTQLNGAILENIIYKPKDQAQTKTLTENLTKALKGLPQYHGNTGEDKLLKRVSEFNQKISAITDFSKLAESDGCLADETTVKEIPSCQKIDETTEKKAAYHIWIRLACEDNTKGLWVAKSMVSRAITTFSTGFAPMLAAQIDQPESCPGMTGIDFASKNYLLNAANNL